MKCFHCATPAIRGQTGSSLAYIAATLPLTLPGAPALVWSGQLTTQSCKHQLCNRIARNYGNFLEMWNRHYFGHELKLTFLWQCSEIRKKNIMCIIYISKYIRTIIIRLKARLPVCNRWDLWSILKLTSNSGCCKENG